MNTIHHVSILTCCKWLGGVSNHLGLSALPCSLGRKSCKLVNGEKDLL